MNKLGRKQEIDKITVEIIERTELVLADPGFEKRPDLKELVQQYLEQFQTNNNVETSLKDFCDRIGWEYLANNKDFPQLLVELYYQLRVQDSEYDSVNFSATQAGLTWFEK